jgi:hypothetical protein
MRMRKRVVQKETAEHIAEVIAVEAGKEQELRDLIAAVGLDTARRVLAEMERRLRE